MRHETRCSSGVTRRDFFRTSLLCTLSAGLASATTFLQRSGWAEAGEPPNENDVVNDTFNGLLAFVVPGDDEYSVVQGVSDETPGGVAANVLTVLRESLDAAQPVPGASGVAAGALNFIATQIAAQLNIDVSEPFSSPFANLPFPAKVAVFDTLRTIPETKVLASSLPFFAAFLIYSEAGSFDPATGTLVGIPTGWTLSDYGGLSRGEDDFEGYYDHRRKADTH